MFSGLSETSLLYKFYYDDSKKSSVSLLIKCDVNDTNV